MFLFLSILLTHGESLGQSSSIPGFRRYSVDDGLSQGTINAIHQDHEGFIWIGTLDGLNRFDGIEFRTWRHVPGDTLSLSDSWITSIHEDAEHRLWIGTMRGLNEFDRRTGKIRRYGFDQGNGRRSFDFTVSKIQSAGGAGADPVAATSRGLVVPNRTDGSVDTLERVDSSRAAGNPAAGGGPWFWMRDAMYTVDMESRRVVRGVDIPLANVTSALPSGGDSTGRFLVGSVGAIYHVDVLTPAIDTIARDISIYSMVADGRGGTWLASGDGLSSLKPDASGWRAVRAGLDGVAILSLCRDSSGTVWAGSIDGLYRMINSTPVFTVFRHREDDANSLASNFVMPILEDRSGRLWFGTLDRGVSVLSPDGSGGGRFRNFPMRSAGGDGPWGNNIRSILQTRDGMVWMGTDAGLTLCDSSPRFLDRFREVPEIDSLSLWVDALFEAGDGTLWAGSSGARLVRIDRHRDRPPSFTRYTLLREGERAVSLGVNAIVEDGEGILWVGSEAGLFRFDPATGSVRRSVHDPDAPTGLSNTFVWSLHVERREGRDVLWIGTSQGLNRFDPETGEWKAYLAQEGFPNDWVYGILPDDSGRFWLTTNRGITCFDDRKPDGMKFRNYDVTDGIAGNECNRRAFAKLRSGEIIFGGTSGVTRFDPNRPFHNRRAPPVVLTSVLNAGEKLDLDVGVADLKELHLGHDQNDLSFEFAALDYANPAKNEYAYRMDGRDRDWTYIGNRRSVSYAGLAPGEYVFRVKASNNDGVWNEAGVSLAIVIDPPLWRTWWFTAAGLATVVLGIVGYYRAREFRARQIFEMRRKIARDLHDEIGSNLTGIAVSGSLLKESGPLTPDQEGRVADITSIAVRTAELMRDLIWVIRPESDRLDDLGFRIKDAANGILAGTTCHFAIPENLEGHRLDLEVKHNLYLIFKETIANIARHAEATEVSVTLEVSGGGLVLIVTDNGVGFETTREAGGMGLKNLAARASAIGGTIEVKSSPGEGTRVTLSVPFT